MTLLSEQTVYVPPRATAFRAVCERCLEGQLASRGYLGATVDGSLALERSAGSAVCARGHAIRVVRALPESNYR
jgi:hypothetical protein